MRFGLTTKAISNHQEQQEPATCITSLPGNDFPRIHRGKRKKKKKKKHTRETSNPTRLKRECKLISFSIPVMLPRLGTRSFDDEHDREKRRKRHVR